MSVHIELTTEQEAALLQSVLKPDEHRQTELHEVEFRLPSGEVVLMEITAKPSKPAPPRKTPSEAVAAWKATGLPSVFARDMDDATVIARRLRAQAERREWISE